MLQGKRKIDALEKKYNTTGFMYTEYPHKSMWSHDFGQEDYKKAILDVLKEDRPVLLYVHIPFCEQLCWFCTCHISISKS